MELAFWNGVCRLIVYVEGVSTNIGDPNIVDIRRACNIKNMLLCVEDLVSRDRDLLFPQNRI